MDLHRTSESTENDQFELKLTHKEHQIIYDSLALWSGISSDDEAAQWKDLLIILTRTPTGEFTVNRLRLWHVEKIISIVQDYARHTQTTYDRLSAFGTDKTTPSYELSQPRMQRNLQAAGRLAVDLEASYYIFSNPLPDFPPADL